MWIEKSDNVLIDKKRTTPLLNPKHWKDLAEMWEAAHFPPCHNTLLRFLVKTSPVTQPPLSYIAGKDTRTISIHSRYPHNCHGDPDGKQGGEQKGRERESVRSWQHTEKTAAVLNISK